MKHKRRFNRSVFLAALVLTLALLAAACSPGGDSGTTTTALDEEQSFTLEELAQYDGKEGRKAYIAVDGIVYDVSEISQWSGGVHQNRFPAGKDYSEGIRSQSPHGTSMLSRAKRVGVLVE